MKKIIFPLLFSLTLLFQNIYARGPAKVQNFINYKNWSFVENKGQLATPNPLKRANGFDLHPEIKYYGHQGGVYLYCKPGMISFVFTRRINEPNAVSEATAMPINHLHFRTTNNQQPTTISTNRADLILLNSNPNAQIIASDQQEYYENFYLAHTPEEGITNVHTFKTITYKNIYPNIDMVLHASPAIAKATAGEDGIKYEFVVYPGGNVSDIRIKWNGLETISNLENDGISYKFKLGEMKETKPHCYQESKEVSSSFKRGNNIIGFKINNYNQDKTLLIDPDLVWGTYFGGDGALGLAIDSQENVFITGGIQLGLGLATTGAYQTSYAGYGDVFIGKLDRNGSCKWATYYGGNGGEAGYAIVGDYSGNIYLTGLTSSSSGIVTSGVYQTSPGGKSDAFLAKFTTGGTRVWATYFGRDSDDVAKSIAIDTSNNIVISGYTFSSSGIATSGAYQTVLSGSEDAFIAKFTNKGQLIWSSYFGGNSIDASSGIITDSKNSIYITGFSRSKTGVASSGAHQSSYGGGASDAFLAKFSDAGKLIWSTYYGGDTISGQGFGSGYEYGNGIAIDHSDNIFITGSTTSLNGISTTGSYKTSPYFDIYDIFLAKFNSNGVIQWGTYYGGYSYDASYAIATDKSGNVYFTGYTNSYNGIATSGSYQSTYGNYGEDAFLVAFNGNGNRLWGTYYGSPYGDDIGYGIAIGKFGDVFLTGETQSKTGIATSGAYKTAFTIGSGPFIAKFSFINIDAGIASIQNPVPAYCEGIHDIKVQLKNYGLSEIDSVNIGWTINKKVQPVYSWKGKLKFDSVKTVDIGSYNFKAGTDTVKVWTIKSNGIIDSLPNNDSASAVFNTNPLPDARHVKNNAICSGNGEYIGAPAVKGNSYKWTAKSYGNFLDTSSNPFVYFGNSSWYYLTEKINATGCTKTDSLKIIINPRPKPAFICPVKECFNDNSFTFSNKSGIDSGKIVKYLYRFGDGDTSSLISPIHRYKKAGVYYATLKTISDSGCSDSTTKNIGVYESPVPNFKLKNTSQCYNANKFSFVDSSYFNTGSIVSWKWDFGDSIYSNASNPSHKYKLPGIYKVILLVASDSGCTDTSSMSISVNPEPVASFAISKNSQCFNANNFKFYDSSKISAGSIRSRFWNFGNSDTSYSLSPDISYNILGRYKVILTATSDKGCKDTTSHFITVFPQALPGFISNNSSQCLKNNVFDFTDTSKISSGAIVTRIWTFGDGDTSNARIPNHTFQKPGQFLVSLQTTTDNGCIDSVSQKVIVNPMPIAFTGSDNAICKGDSINIGDVPVSGSQYYWFSIPVGFLSNISNPKIKPLSTTIYVLTEVAKISGCSKTDSVKISVKPLPNAKWTMDYFGDFTYLHAQDSSLNNTRYLWQFGDGDSAMGHLAKHVYPKNKNYFVNLRVTGNNNCVNELDSTIMIAVSRIKNNMPDSLTINCYPNPFSTSTSLQYHLNKTSQINISFFDITGKQIALLTNEKQIPGDYSTDINAEKYHLLPGVYLLKFMVDGQLTSKQLIKF